MASKRNTEVVAEAFGSWLRDDMPVRDVRAGYDRMAPPVPEDVTVEQSSVGGVPGLWFTPPGASPATVSSPHSPAGLDERSSRGRFGAGAGRAVLYFHGGGFTIGSPRSHADLTARIAKAAGVRLFSAEYALAPEKVFPAALRDALAAYRGLLAEGVRPERLALAGDSAGGGIALAAMVALRDAGEPLPACAVTLSAWSDLSCGGRSYHSNVELDPLVTPEMGLRNAATYLDGHDPTDPLASPVFADLSGLPPLLLQVGTDEMLLDDTLRLVDNARAAGVAAELQVADGMMHVYQLITWLLPEAQQAIDKIGVFVRRHLSG